MSKYFTDAEIKRLVKESEDEIDRREAQRQSDARLAMQLAWINDPANKARIDSDPIVQYLRANDPKRSQPNVPSQTPRLTPHTAHTTPSGLPPGYKSRAQLERERPWLAPRKTELQSIIDPMAGRKPNRI
jgi:hypothetical protein